MPLGLLADRFNRNSTLAGMGCALVALAYIPVPALAAVFLAGLGNACFHIGGGLDVLNAGRRCTALGLFVSPGAIGLWLGGIWGKGDSFPALLPPLVLLTIGVGFFLFQRYACPHGSSGNVPFALPHEPSWGWGVAALFAVVVVRSYVGMTLFFPWKGDGHWPLLMVLALAGGKALGGLLADRFGVVRFSIISLIVAALCFLGSTHPVLGVAAVLLFNMTMPLTLWATARLLPGAKGFSFGLLTFALFLGFLPVCLGAPQLLSGPVSCALACLFSLLLLYPGLRKAGA